MPRGIQQPTPSAPPGTSTIIPPIISTTLVPSTDTPAMFPPSITTTTPASTSTQQGHPPLHDFHRAVSLLQAQTDDLYTSLGNISASQTSFQTNLTNQFNQFQHTMLETIRRLQIPNTTPPTSTYLLPSSTPSTVPHISFGSVSPISTTWSGLGLSNPPPPLPNSATPSASPSHPHVQHMSTTPLYSTLVSTSNQLSTPLAGPISSSSPHLLQTADHGYYSPLPNNFPLPNHTFNPHHDYPYYRPPRVNLPRFNGEDIVGWLAMAERHIRLHRIPFHERAATVTSHFGPDASVWMNAFELRHPIISWDQLVTALLEHFGSGTSSDFTAALSHLQHSSSVDDYISAFTKLSCCAPD